MRCGEGEMTPEDLLAANLIWVVPIGNHALLGFAVCRRVVNNGDSAGNTRIDYLKNPVFDPGYGGAWKSPFRESSCMFPDRASAVAAALSVVGFWDERRRRSGA